LTLLSVEKLRSTPAVVTGSVTRIVNRQLIKGKVSLSHAKNFCLDQSRGAVAPTAPLWIRHWQLRCCRTVHVELSSSTATQLPPYILVPSRSEN